jgi:hypothetical protein
MSISGSGSAEIVLSDADAKDVSKQGSYSPAQMPPSLDRLLKYTDTARWSDILTVTVEKNALVAWLRKVIELQPFDEEWYLKTYPDVRDAVNNGRARSGRQHYIDSGYFECRLPGLFGFQAEKYLELNPDLRDLSKDQALQHFIYSGYREGRDY